MAEVLQRQGQVLGTVVGVALLQIGRWSTCRSENYYSNDPTSRERQSWRCSNCMVWGTAVWAVRDGPDGPRVSQFPSREYSVCTDHPFFLDSLPQLRIPLRAGQDHSRMVKRPPSSRHPRRPLYLDILRVARVTISSFPILLPFMLFSTSSPGLSSAK